MIITKEKTIKRSPSLPLQIGQQTMKTPNAVEMTKVEEPPPYVHHTPASASTSHLRAQSSTVPRQAPPLPPRSSAVQPHVYKPPPAPFMNATNHLYIKTRHESITGVYHIDPEKDTVALGKEGIMAQDRRLYNRKHKQRHRHHGRKGFWRSVDIPDPNAIFQTRQGAIAIDLGVIATPGSPQSRAVVQAATKQGPININVIGVHVQRHLKLEVSTHNGNVHILIPRSFSGYIQLYSRNGNLLLLPHLASAMQVVYRRDKEMQVIVGRAIEVISREETPSHDKATVWTGDTLHVASRGGDVVIGYLGEDAIPVEEKGFWKKLTDFFQS